MRKGIRPGTEMRCELLRILLEQNMSLSMMSKITEPMRGKTEAEKETIAEQLIARYSTGAETIAIEKHIPV